MKKLLILGASGSIGQQTVEVVDEHPDLFEITAVSVGVNVACLAELIRKHQPEKIYVSNQDDWYRLKECYPKIQWLTGSEGLVELVRTADYDILVNGLSGFTGVVPTIEAIKRKKDIALANKESLVVAGNLVNELKEKYDVTIRPIDSEHSAIWQCLQGNSIEDVKRVIITASGGSFRDLDRDQLKSVKVSDALNHPNWSMGPRITIDSASMMNKCFEVVEAHHLFGLKVSQITVVIHPQSIIHSLVEFVDGALIAQLGNPDMRIAIQYALSHPKRLPLSQKASFHMKTMEFRELDEYRFPLISLANRIIENGDCLGCVVNAADEMAVQAFLQGKIDFLEIEDLVFTAAKAFAGEAASTIEELIALDHKVRIFVNKEITLNQKF